MNITDALVQNASKDESPLSLLGVKSGQKEPNLLTEVLDGSLDSPGAHSALSEHSRNEGFESAKREARKTIKSNFLGNPLEPEDAIVEEKEETPLEVPVKEEEPEEFQEAAATPAKSEEDIPPYFLTLNHQYQMAQQAAEEASRKADETQQYMKQYLNDYRQNNAKPEAVPYEQYGFESPDQYIAFRDQIKKEAVMEMQKANMPILQQLVTDKFNTAVARMESQNEHWKEYFPANYVSNFYNQVSQNYPVDYLAKVNWEAELSNAYTVKDYPRLLNEFTKLKQQGESASKQKQEVKNSEKEERKNNLKLVPKASQKGAGSAPASTSKESVFPQGKRSKIGFDGVVADLKAQMKSQFA